MNSLYTLALRQTASIQQDLVSLEQALNPSPTGLAGPSSALNGQITASLAALDRTVEDYDNMARREIVEAKRDKALSRVARFRDDYASLRKQHDRIKATGASQKAAADRDLLFASSSSGISSSASFSLSNRNSSSRIPGSPITAESPFTINMGSPQNGHGGNGNGHGDGGGGGGGGTSFRPNSPFNDFGTSVHNNSRTKHALGENDFLHSTGATLDAYIAQGQAVLGNLSMQKDMLKGTKRRLLSAANTLGLSRTTIQYIERRTTGDFYILLGGGTFTLVAFYFILKWFG